MPWYKDNRSQVGRCVLRVMLIISWFKHWVRREVISSRVDCMPLARNNRCEREVMIIVMAWSAARRAD